MSVGTPNELPAGLAVVKRRRRRRRWSGGGGCAGEMRFRLCEVANYLQGTQYTHGVLVLTHTLCLEES